MPRYLALDDTSDINGWAEHYMLIALSIGQKWVVLGAVMAALMCVAIGYMFKVRKNVKAKQMFNFWAIGMVLLAVILIIAPYAILHFLEQPRG